jgi:hypothetical protein
MSTQLLAQSTVLRFDTPSTLKDINDGISANEPVIERINYCTEDAVRVTVNDIQNLLARNQLILRGCS